MEQILIVREVIVKFFKRYEAFILPILKFLLGLFVFTAIQAIGHVHEALVPFTEMFSPTLLSVLFAVLFTVMPTNMGWILMILSITVQFSANIEVAVSVFLFLIFIFLFYARMAQKESILILFTILAFHFNIPYLVPILVGLYFPVTAIIPVTVGVFINAQIPVLEWLMEPSSVAGNITEMEIADILTELPQAFAVVYEALMRSITDTQDWLFSAVIFAMVIVLVHFVSRLAIDFAKEVAIALGSVMNVFGFIVAVMVTDANVSIGLLIISSVLCGFLAEIIRCFDAILDYQRAETVQFEDDNNFYHVRIVPKVMMTKSQRVVKRIRSEADEYDDIPPMPPTGRRPIIDSDTPPEAPYRRPKNVRDQEPLRQEAPYRRPRPIPGSDTPQHETAHRWPVSENSYRKSTSDTETPVYENAHRRPTPVSDDETLEQRAVRATPRPPKKPE